MAGDFYPPVGFHFNVFFAIPGVTQRDFSFQSVSGLNVSVATDSYSEGGENRFVHKFPKQVDYESNLVLKRGLVNNSTVIQWVKLATQSFTFIPVQMIISLLNENHLPVRSWTVFNAYPVKWSVSDFNAMDSSVVIETLELEYQFFRDFSLPSIGGLG